MRQVQVAPANVQSQKKTFSNSLGLPSHSFRPTAPVSHTRAVAHANHTAAPKSTGPERQHESDAHVVTSAVYRDNGEGYLDPKRHNHIWVLDVPTTSDELTKPRHLTTREFDEAEPFWSHDGSRIYFITRRIDEPYYELPTTDMYSVPSAGGDP